MAVHAKIASGGEENDTGDAGSLGEETSDGEEPERPAWLKKWCGVKNHLATFRSQSSNQFFSRLKGIATVANTESKTREDIDNCRRT